MFKWSPTIIILIIAVLLSIVLIYMMFRKPNSKGTEHYEKSEKPETQPSQSGSLVLFHGDFCGHCQKMKPEWEKLKSMLPPDVKVYEIESKDSKMNDFRDSVSGFPTIRFYRGEPSPGSQGIDYTGDRTASAILQFVESTK